MNQLDLLSFTPADPLPITIFPHQVIVPVDISERRDNAYKLFKIVRNLYDATGDDGTFFRFVTIVLTVLNRHSDGDGPYLDAIKGMSRKALDIVAQGWALLVEHFWHEGCFYDILGDVYMQVRSDWAGKRMGQYFTPWSLCMMSAQMMIEGYDIKHRLKHGPTVTVYEPCLGSGAMLLAFKAVICDKFGGRRSLKNLEVSGQDLDQVCVTMAKIQLMMSNDRFMTSFMLSSHCEVRS